MQCNSVFFVCLLIWCCSLSMVVHCIECMARKSLRMCHGIANAIKTIDYYYFYGSNAVRVWRWFACAIFLMSVQIKRPHICFIVDYAHHSSPANLAKQLKSKHKWKCTVETFSEKLQCHRIIGQTQRIDSLVQSAVCTFDGRRNAQFVRPTPCTLVVQVTFRMQTPCIHL